MATANELMVMATARLDVELHSLGIAERRLRAFPSLESRLLVQVCREDVDTAVTWLERITHVALHGTCAKCDACPPTDEDGLCDYCAQTEDQS